ncbi:MAG: hypothetical protein JRI95_10580 [Deltaproteobacteria bacterium]|nr:hypothetical protein [Deltaproteobacteria bacterium]
MSDTVLIFSIDKLRGGITQKVLKRSGFEALLLPKVFGAIDAIEKHVPGVVIFDASGCFSEEVNQIRNLCETLEHIPVIVFGKWSIIARFEGHGIRKELLISDPLDPELIVAKVKEALSLNLKEKPSERDTLEKDLKAFLNLD